MMPAWQSKALAIINTYRYARMILGDDVGAHTNGSVLTIANDRSKNARPLRDATWREVAKRERLRTFVQRVEEVMSMWDEVEREIIRRKYLSQENFLSDDEVWRSLRADGYRLTKAVYRNAKDGALANLAASIREVA